MILHKDGIFLLKNSEFSYLFRVGKYGELQHLHFGAPVEISDAEALTPNPGPGWGSNLLLDDGDPHSCPDYFPLEWERQRPGRLPGEPSGNRKNHIPALCKP